MIGTEYELQEWDAPDQNDQGVGAPRSSNRQPVVSPVVSPPVVTLPRCQACGSNVSLKKRSSVLIL